MVLNGYIDERNQLWVRVTVAGQTGQKEIQALVDTGFTGELQLPLIVAVPLGLRLSGVGTFELADGSTSQEMLFAASIQWGTTLRSATVVVANTDTPLMGGGLLHGYVLLVDFEKKLLTIKEPGTDEPEVLSTESGSGTTDVRRGPKKRTRKPKKGRTSAKKSSRKQRTRSRGKR